MRTAERVLPARMAPASRPDASGQPHRALTYRPALDGLRAVAVLAVFGYHLGYRPLRGGFLGVDVFFVLSGFLITTVLLLEHARTGRISLGAFWARRARRLLPALLLVVITVALWESATAATFELPQRRTDLLWALFYGSNWNLVASAQDYFAQYQSASFVRHTWSLAIEEQFYLVWPIVVLGALWLARGRARGIVAVCVAGIAASMTLMWVLYSPADPSRAYYGTEARMHQLLIGALLAVLLMRVPAIRRPRRSGSLAAVVGMSVLVVAFISLGDATMAYYTGLSAVVAVATALLIWGLEVAPRSLAARALGVAPARWTGKISYGVYLWHWPVILAIGVPVAAFAWMPARLGLDASRVLFTLAIAGLSYRLVERPIREGTFPLIRASLKRSAVALVATTLLAGAAIVSWTTVSHERDLDRGGATLDRLGCQLEVCVRYVAPDAAAPVVAVIGDSVARSLDLGFVRLAERMGWTYVVAASDGCRVTHLLTVVGGDRSRYAPCYASTPELWRGLLDDWDPDLVLMVDSVELADLVTPSGAIVAAGDPAHLAAEHRGLQEIARTFVGAGTRLGFVAFPPVVTPPDCLREDTQDLDICAIPASRDRNVETYNEILVEIASRSPAQVFVVSVTDHLCPNAVCRPAPDGVFARYDGHHFTTAGARWIVPLLHRELIEAGVLPSSMR
jgi:peptidoglycan/LPS O-acetylase OafA/YrhL